MSIYIRYLIATLFCLFIAMFLWDSFLEASLFELSAEPTTMDMINYSISNNLYILQLAIGSIPILVMLTALLNKQNNIKTIVVTAITILVTGILTWQARIVLLNLKIKRINYLISSTDNDIIHSIQMDKMLLEHYFFAGLVLGAIMINIYFYLNRTRIEASKRNA